MKIKLYYGKPTNYDFNEIIDQFSPNSINSVQTSTIPLLDYWKNTQEKIKFLKDKLNLESKNFKLCFEYPTRSYKSKKSSMSDLMIIGENEKIAVEAKYTEVVKIKIKKIEDWNNNTEDREKVLDYWIDKITPFVVNQIDKNKIGTIPYQFLHRTASACFENNGKAYVIYQIFYDSQTKEKMGNFISLLKESVENIKPSERLRFYIFSIKVDLIKEIKKDSVLNFLKNHQLYKFENEVLYEIKS